VNVQPSLCSPQELQKLFFLPWRTCNCSTQMLKVRYFRQLPTATSSIFHPHHPNWSEIRSCIIYPCYCNLITLKYLPGARHSRLMIACSARTSLLSGATNLGHDVSSMDLASGRGLFFVLVFQHSFSTL